MCACAFCKIIRFVKVFVNNTSPGVGFTKGLKSKICLKSKLKVLNVKNFVMKLKQNKATAAAVISRLRISNNGELKEI